MVNTTSKRKRKSHNNRTRLSRRVKRGGVLGGGIFSMLSGLLPSRDSKQESEEKKAVTDKSKPEETETKPETKSKDKTAVVTEKALDKMSITNEANYLQVLNNTRALYNLTYEIINTGVITEEIKKKLTAEQQASNVLERVLAKMKAYNTTRLANYEKLFKTTIPVYPYARIQTKEDKTHPNYIAKLNKIQALKDKKTYTNNDYYIRGWGEGG